MKMEKTWDVIIVGGGIAGLSAAIYLARAKRSVLVIDEEKSMARWEPDVENFLGFPDGISGEELLKRAKQQAEKYHAKFYKTKIIHLARQHDFLVAQSKDEVFQARRILLATGTFHEPPEIEGVADCLGKSMFFCKDCDGYKIQGKKILIYGNNNESVEYALAMKTYSDSIGIVTDDDPLSCDEAHHSWLEEYQIPVYTSRIIHVEREHCQIQSLVLEDGKTLQVEALFTTRGDVCINQLAHDLEAKVDDEGQIIVDHCLQTTAKGLYAAGCVTPANCQMIIAAGQGAQAAQAINRDLFEESLKNHTLTTTTPIETF